MVVAMYFSNCRSNVTRFRGESPETFLEFVTHIPRIETHNMRFSQRNRVLLALIWLRTYHTYRMLASLLDISASGINPFQND